MFLTLGDDWNWWLAPTIPVLKINYFEKLYTIKQLKKMREFEEDDDDPNRKRYAEVERKANTEKNILVGLSILTIIGWFAVGRYQIQALIS